MFTNSFRGRLWLLIPLLMADIVDNTITLVAQPAEYWRGSYLIGIEYNPIARWFLTSHPLAFIGYCLVELIIVSKLITVLPEIAAKILSAIYSITFANSISNWMAWRYHTNVWVTNLPLIIVSVILVYAFEKASEYKRNSFRLNNRYSSPSRR